MKQRSKLREWLIDHFDAVVKTFPSIDSGEMRRQLARMNNDNHLLFIYGMTHVTVWPETISPPNREPLDRLLGWGYDQDDIMSATLWMELNNHAAPDQYIEVKPLDLIDPSRN